MIQKNILLVDDEIKIIVLIKDYLEAENFNVITAKNGQEALEIFFEEEHNLNLIILDVMMPEVDGFSVCREIRKKSTIPILMLTARSEDYDELHGFEIGADDYVKKPVRPATLMARIHAIFRRTENKDEQKDIVINDIFINRGSHIVKVLDEVINLSPKEYELLIILIEESGRVISREQLLKQVWGYDYFGGLRTVDTHINRLRTKLLNCGDLVVTVRGYGYRFEVGNEDIN